MCKDVSPNEAAEIFLRMVEKANDPEEAKLRAMRQKKTDERNYWLEKVCPGYGPYDAEKVVIQIMKCFPNLKREEILQMNPAKLGPWLKETAEKMGVDGEDDPPPPGTLETYTKTITEAADFVGCNRTTMYRWVRDNRIQAECIGGTNYRFPKSELDGKKESRKNRKSRLA